MQRRSIERSAWVALGWLGCWFLPLAVAGATEDRLLLELLSQHCLDCHGQAADIAGEVPLDLRSREAFVARPELLSRMVEAVRDAEMPPAEHSRWTAGDRQRFLAGLEAWLADSLLHAAYPRTPIRRMTRLQYSNTVEDLLELKVELFALPERTLREYNDYFQPASGSMPPRVTVGNRALGKSQLIQKRLAGVAPFPQDLPAEYGFDNQGSNLTLSPLLMESLLTLSQSIVHSPDFGPKTCGLWEGFFLANETRGPDDDELRRRLQGFLDRAFRRDTEQAVVERYLQFVRARLAAGVDFTETMKEVVAAVLVSPKFLYLYEEATEGDQPQLIDDFELASRVSFFLWGSMPDDRLLALANAGRLHEPTVLSAELERMMNDRRMKRFCDAFPLQWLQLESLIASTPDPEVYKDFYFLGDVYRGSSHMMLEPLLVFETVFVENRSILDFIHSEYSYRSDLLDKFYRFEATKGGKPTQYEFDRIPITSPREGGVITTAAVLTMTSNARRTQPITRGAWLVSAIFNDPPPPPPADVPPLEEGSLVDERSLTLREKLSLHQTRADCASCHAKIDPFGFALENFDAIGRWRDRYEDGQAIDAGGQLFHRLPFASIEEFKEGLMAEKDRFTRALAAHLLQYALGRKIELRDQAALDGITQATVGDGYRLRALIKHVAMSEPFQTKFHPRPTEARPAGRLKRAGD
jgi:hypothetical protein